MRTSLPLCVKIILVCCLTILAISSAFAAVSGAIYTTDSTGTKVNGNIYDAKTAVYLNGGPQNKQDPGLPDGTYYFQVTDPSGAVLLSADDISCRQVVVSGGRITGVPSGTAPASCTGTTPGGDYHPLGTFNSANGEQPIGLCPATPSPRTDNLSAGANFDPNNWCDTTPNSGGEYKAWLTPVANWSLDGSKCSTPSRVSYGFCDADSKTDNFKVKKPNVAYVSVCKFNDLDGNGTQDPGEPFIPGWPITATGVDTLSGPIGTVNAQTDATGCVAFSVSDFTTAGGVVTLTEGFQTGNWQQTAPAIGTYNVPDGVVPADSGTVAVDVAANTATPPTNFETLTLVAGDNVAAPNFGNTCLDSTCGGNSVVLTVTKDANPSLTRTYTWGITKTVDDASVKTAGGAPHTFNYTVSVTHDAGTDSGWQVTGTIMVTNPSLIDLPGVTISDSVDNGGTCTVTGGSSITVPANSTIKVPYVCTYSSLPANGTNTATATNALNPGTASIDFSTAAIKVVDGSVTVTDTLGGTLGTVSYTDASPTTFTYSQTFTDPAGTCTSHDNTATFTTNTTGATGNASQSVQDCQGSDLTVSKTATPSFTRTYNWKISKSVDKTEIDTSSGSSVTFNYTVTASETGFTDSGWQVTGTITVTNPNDWEAVTVNLADSIDNGGTCTITGGATQTVPASSSITPSYTCTYTSAPSPSSFTNTVTATWDKTAASTPTGSATGTAGGSFGTPTTLVNQTITPTDTFDGGIAQTLCSLTSTPSSYCTLTAVDSGTFTSHTYTYSRTITAPTGTCATHNNTAATGLTGTGQTDSKSVKVCGASPLTVSKTATPSFTSAISKSVNQTKVEQSGGSVTFNYTVTVTESGWTVTGNITVYNPNDWEAITASVSDAIDGGGSCKVNGSSSASTSVPAKSGGVNGSATLPYTCTYTTNPTLVSGTNTATATWNAATYFTSTGSASGTAGYTFATLTVTDTVQSSANPGGCNATLGTVDVILTGTKISSSPGCGVTSLATPKWGVFTYSITDTNASPGMCTPYNNTASIPGSSASQTVTVCNTATGALTMGFWKNTNGQKIINAGASTGSVCNSGTWLRQFNPFKDLSSTATCSQVASYVNTVISAATCSSTGNTCNAMLRAQMLATALDVYFSTPGLGGNQIGAYNNLGNKTPALGGVVIDLSKVCDGSDGGFGGSCPEDTRREFGICTGLNTPVNGCTAGVLGTTVLNMLLYSDFASINFNGNPVASPTTGSIWYMQMKGLQVPAKDAFDSINNQIAPIAPSGVGVPSY